MILITRFYNKKTTNIVTACFIFLNTCLFSLASTTTFAVELKPLEDQRASQRRPLKKSNNNRSGFKYKPGLNKNPAPSAGTSKPVAAAAKKKTTRPAPKKKTKKIISGSADAMLFNFQDADIKAVIKTISQITKTNFILDPRVKGKVTIISAKPV
jgi:type II secretory pathway component HofQ